jgi:hypothetical protein
LLNQQTLRVLSGFVLMKARTATKKEFIRVRELLNLVALVLTQKVELLF